MMWSMFGKVRPALLPALIGAAAIVGCGASVEGDDGWQDDEIVSTQHALTTKKLDASVYRRSSNAKKFRGAGANYVVCANDPFMMAYTFKNTGTVAWRDVRGRGTTAGSDVKLVAWRGRVDPLANRTFLSLADNKNDYVRADRNAGNCSTKPGCRRTTFNSGGLWAIAPSTPGTYTSGWRLRDFSRAWGDSSKGFGPRTKLRFKVMSCEADPCGCTAWCSDGRKIEPTAGANNCESVSRYFCEPAQLVGHYYQACRDDPPGTGGSGGWSGGSGSGGTSSGGTSSGGTSSGGTSSGGTSSGSGGAAGFQCGSTLCELPDIPNGQPQHCCTAQDRCGVTTPYVNGKCIEIPTDDELDDNGFGPAPLGEDDLTDPEDFIEPDVEEYRGEAIADSGGCSTSGGGGGSGLGWLGAVGLLALRRRRP
jgi:MYXO-CTERM domain-containing protein